MKYRKLRIAWSVACGVAAVMLIALWVRSYWWMDSGRGIFFVRILSFNSYNGRIGFASLWGDGTASIQFNSIPRERMGTNQWVYENSRGFVFFNSSVIELIVPHWFAVLLTAALAAAPWSHHFRWRFSLRTLLIATTLVAVGLGLIVWLR